MILTKHVQVRTSGRLGRVTLDRPEAINALTQSMIEEIGFTLELLAEDPGIATVVLDGVGERGFCAGGDVVALRGSALKDGAAARRFWRAEYRLNARIASFPKPIVAIMDGIVMGGGVGLACHAAHRVATETLVWAMPEVTIGFAPDVGGTYLLSRLPGELGTWIALTAQRLDAATAQGVGLVDRIVARDDLDDLLERLAIEDVGTVLGAGERGTTAASLDRTRRWVDSRFAGDDAAAIERRLAAEGDVEARAALRALRKGSPTSVAVTLSAMRIARRLPSLEQCLEQEYRTSCSFLAVEDFCEGIRAALVDKDRRPRWQPSSLDRVDDALVERILSGPGDVEPLFDDAGREGSVSWTSA
ncbi:MAG TPA: enoyl-CoA hydratase/isomerase family protein [Solirubrobacterales bacterium]|nr:enoyl-CoA hydratase/isomerase family protein [Solirubrobacterales bacterium]